MEVTFSAKTTAECIEYLHIIFECEKYKIDEFSVKFKGDDFSLDEKLKRCKVEYRGTTMTYAELCENQVQFSTSLPFFERYYKEIYPQEYLILLSNYNYYKAAKFLNKAEKCLEIARYYLIKGNNLLSIDFDINWSSGYGAQTMIRTMDITTAIIWYNNCFDYILQIIYLAFELYKKVPRYNENMIFENVLKKCSYDELKKIYGLNRTVQNYSTLWEIITDCRTSLLEVNKWANYIKHKGGINFIGLTPSPPFYLTKTDLSGNVIAESNEFEPVKIDLDQSISILQVAHKTLYDCLDQIVTFIDFDSAKCETSVDGRCIIPDKTKYVKVILP